MANNKENKLRKQILQLTRKFLDGDFSSRIEVEYDADDLSEIARNLNIIADRFTILPEQTQYALNNAENEIIEVITAFGNHDFSKRAEISNSGTLMDAISVGVNMLGNELKETVVSNEFFQSVFNSVSEILIVFEHNGKIKRINQAGIELFKVKFEIKQNDFWYFSDEVFFTQLIQKVLFEIKHLNDQDEFELEGKINNQLHYFSCNLRKIKSSNINHSEFLLYCENITNKKNKTIEDIRLITHTQEQERKRISRDIHDSLGQELNGIKMHLQVLKELRNLPEKHDHTLMICQETLLKADKSARRLAFDLMPPALEKGGLWYAIEQFFKSIEKFCPVNYTFPEFECTLLEQDQISVFRIVQEFYNNSLKYARPKQLNMLVARCDYGLQFELSDCGVGFNINKVKPGNGIKNMMHRLDSMRAKVNFNSKKNSGTQLIFSIEHAGQN